MGFKGYSPQNEWQNPKKKIKIPEFHGMIKGGIDYNFQGWIMCKSLGVDGNFQFFVEILGFKGYKPTKWVTKFINKLKIPSFIVWWREVLINISHDE